MKKLRVPYVGKQFGTPGGDGLTVHEAIELHLTDCRQRSQNQHIKKGAPDEPHAPKVRAQGGNRTRTATTAYGSSYPIFIN
jgi:hypothetical protein